MKATTAARAVHAFVRAPHYRSIPSTSPTGIVVNRDMLNHQFRDFYKTLQRSTLVDKVHLMSERPGVDSLRVSDHMACIGPTFLGMPLTGLEHRATEFMETMRYVRGAGGPTSVSAYMQDNEACRCHSGDIVCLPTGIAVGHGPRTNATAHQILRELFAFTPSPAQQGGLGGGGAGAMRFDVFTLEQEGDAPPLGDYLGFAGNDILLVWKDEHGLLAVDQLQQLLAAQQQQHGEEEEGKGPLRIVYLEPGCHFLTFYGVDFSTDVLVQKGYERSMDSIAAAGLNPIPVQWSEMDKLGISLRSAVLPLKFLEAGATPGMLTRSRTRGGRWQSYQIRQ